VFALFILGYDYSVSYFD